MGEFIYLFAPITSEIKLHLLLILISLARGYQSLQCVLLFDIRWPKHTNLSKIKYQASTLPLEFCCCSCHLKLYLFLS